MSMKCFLALETPLQKTAYKYKDILPTIESGDMWYDGGIGFRAELSEQEKCCLGDVFKNFQCYAIDSELGLEYETRYGSVISKSYATNALEELKWLKAFAKKQLMKQDVFMIVDLWLGRKTEFKGQKVIDVNEWDLSADSDFCFECGVVYKFVDNSSEATERRRQRAMRFLA